MPTLSRPNESRRCSAPKLVLPICRTSCTITWLEHALYAPGREGHNNEHE